MCSHSGAEHYCGIRGHVHPMFSVFKHNLPMTMDGPISSNANVQIAVCASIDERIEADHRFENGTPVDDNTRCPDEVSLQKLQTVVALDTYLWGCRYWRSIRPNQCQVSINEGTFLMGLQRALAGLDGVRQKTVVRIQEHQ